MNGINRYGVLLLLTSLNGNKRNSSVPTTCWKFCNAYLCDLVCSSLHEWASIESGKKRTNNQITVQYSATKKKKRKKIANGECVTQFAYMEID